MKKILWVFLGFLLPMGASAADNNIKMVTYFPVPYASYNDLGVVGSCDVGLGNSCELNAGKGLTVMKNSNASDTRALNSGSLILKKGNLSLDSSYTSSQIEGTTLKVGDSLDYTSTSDLTFTDLQVGTVNSSLSSVQSDSGYVYNLELFGQSFPYCDSYDISWKKLTFNNTTGVFLTCGEGVAEEPECYGDTYYDSDTGMCQCYDSSAVWYEGYCCTYDDQSYPCWGEYWDTLCDYYEGGCYSWEDSDPYWEPTGMTSNWVGGPLACNSGYCGSCTESNIGETCIDSCWLDNDPDYGGAGYCYCETYTCWKPEEEYCEEPYYDCYEVTGFSQYFPDGGVSYYDPEEYPNGY